MTVSAVLPCCLSKVITQWAGRAKKLPQAATDNLLDKITLLPFTVPKRKKKLTISKTDMFLNFGYVYLEVHFAYLHSTVIYSNSNYDNVKTFHA